VPDTFKAVEQGYLGGFAGESIYFSNVANRQHTIETPFDISKLSKLPQVDILYAYQNDGRYLYDAAVKASSKGIVIAASGNGSLSKTALAGAQDAAEKGVAVARSTRVGSGVVTHKASDDTDGFVSADSLNPQKARVLLMLSLTKTNDPKKIQAYFNKY
jgi:L-asparaginase